jgi:hypothetical protein
MQLFDVAELNGGSIVQETNLLLQIRCKYLLLLRSSKLQVDRKEASMRGAVPLRRAQQRSHTRVIFLGDYPKNCAI